MKTFGSHLQAVVGPDVDEMEATLSEACSQLNPTLAGSLVRQALFQPGRKTRWYQTAYNYCLKLGVPLKPNPITCRVACLSNFTTGALTPMIRIFGVPYGISVEIQTGAYDSVEGEALDPTSPLYAGHPDFVLFLLSEDWLERHLGGRVLVHVDAVATTGALLSNLVDSVRKHSEARVLFALFGPEFFPAPGGYARTGGYVGWGIAIHQLNQLIIGMQDERFFIVDRPGAIHRAGGLTALTWAGNLRSRIPHQAQATNSLAREIAAIIASLCGKSHRALVTDLDNTLWGGIIAESDDVVTGQHDADGRAFFEYQAYLGGLKSLGVLLAVASKNSEKVEDFLVNNDRLAMDRKDFASLKINWNPKSQSIREVSTELGFGSEFMVFVDDSLFELSEAVEALPYLDIVHARTPEDALAGLTEPRLFASAALTTTDLQRHDQIRSQQAGEALKQSFGNYDDYLRSIDIRVHVEPMNTENGPRIAQLLQKTNQFNVTTRRHTSVDLHAFLSRGAKVAAISYEDTFGAQGVVSVVVLVPEDSRLRIDSWVMSCRVLNRHVEHAVHDWIVQQADAKPIFGEFIPTEKNAPASDLFSRLGFHLDHRNDSAEWWRFDPATDTPPAHAATLSTSKTDHGP